MKWLWNKIKADPAAVAAITNIALVQLIAYGFTISSVQLANWNFLIALILGFLTRQAVVPIPVVNSQIKTAIKMPESATVEDVIAVNKKEKIGQGIVTTATDLTVIGSVVVQMEVALAGKTGADKLAGAINLVGPI